MLTKNFLSESGKAYPMSPVVHLKTGAEGTWNWGWFLSKRLDHVQKRAWNTARETTNAVIQLVVIWWFKHSFIEPRSSFFCRFPPMFHTKCNQRCFLSRSGWCPDTTSRLNTVVTFTQYFGWNPFASTILISAIGSGNGGSNGNLSSLELAENILAGPEQVPGSPFSQNSMMIWRVSPSSHGESRSWRGTNSRI